LLHRQPPAIWADGAVHLAGSGRDERLSLLLAIQAEEKIVIPPGDGLLQVVEILGRCWLRRLVGVGLPRS
jgi:hypothetical protein